MIGRWWARLDRTGHLLVIAGAVLLVLVVLVLVATWDTYWSQYAVQNVLPPSVWTLVGIGLAHLQLHKKLDAQHEDMKKHVSREAGNG